MTPTSETLSCDGRPEWASGAARSVRYLRPYFGILAAALACLAIGSGLALAGPLIIRTLVDRGIALRDAGLVARCAALYLLCEVLRQGADFLQALLQRTLSLRVSDSVREHVFAHAQKVSPRYWETTLAGKIVTRLTSDAAVVGEAVSTGAVGLLRDLVVLLGAGIALLALRPTFGAVTLACSLLVTVPAVLFHRTAEKSARGGAESLSRVNATLEENIAGREVSQLFGIEGVRNDRFRRENTGLVDSVLFSLRARALFDAGAAGSSAVATAVVVVAGGWALGRTSLSVGVWLAFLQYLPFVLGAVAGISEKAVNILSGFAVGRGLFSTLDRPEHLPVLSPPRSFGTADGDLEVSDIRFGYQEGEEVLKGVSTRIRTGEKIALIGRSGAGKTTLARLLARMHDPWEGFVRLGGNDLRAFSLEELRRKVAFVTQDVTIFSGTVGSNIALGDPSVGRCEVLSACNAVQAGSVFDQLPRGLDTALSHGGPELSVGQRQLISFARILVRRPEILILDEPTASVDLATEKDILAALRRVSEGRTLIMIAHRISTIRDVDRVLVLDGGRIVQEGSFAVLSAGEGLLASMVRQDEGHLTRHAPSSTARCRGTTDGRSVRPLGDPR